MNVTKIIEILDPQAGTVRESVLQSVNDDGPKNLFEARPGARPVTLMEAAQTDHFPSLLRDGIKAIAFDRYAAVPTTWQEIVDFQPSDKQSEDWIEETQLGELPIVPEGNPFPEGKEDLDRTVNIRNYKRGLILAVTEEMIRFNRTNMIKQQAAKMGRAAANTREQTVYSVLNTAGNYVRADTTGDNDIAANTAATVFSASGLNTALNVLRTMKDRKTGVYLGVMPDTLIVTPRLEMAAMQLLMSPTIAHVAAAAASATVYGSGNSNPFRGLVRRIIVSPRLGTSYQWVLMQAKAAVVLQEVDGLQILQESANKVEYEGYFTYDKVRYRVRDWFGAGMLNDRFAYYSSATNAPTVD